jgi:uncharacterized protein YhbP (UPF0306 family)
MPDIKTDIFKFVKANGIMTLAVCENNIPWVCTVYYGMDDDFNMYIVTGPETRHGKYIKTNKKVAFAVYNSHTKVTENKVGIQGEGTCALVKNPLEVVKGLLLWQKGNPGAETKVTMETIKKFADTRIFKIEPKFLKFFNKDLYGDKEYGEITL